MPNGDKAPIVSTGHLLTELTNNTNLQAIGSGTNLRSNQPLDSAEVWFEHSKSPGSCTPDVSSPLTDPKKIANPLPSLP